MMEIDQNKNSNIQTTNSIESLTTEENITEADAAGNLQGVRNTTANVDSNSNLFEYNRITTPSKYREEQRPHIQWSIRMKTILHGIKATIENERGWMKRLLSKWQGRLPMYSMFSAQNLCDQVKKTQANSLQNINLDVLINEEMEEHKERQLTCTY